jgi:large subunit ribosomal protein L15
VKLHELKPAPGSRKKRTRVGRGIAAGKGKTAGRGTKGQKSRAGGNLPAWFEGGQTPLHIRTPKLHGFRNRGRVSYAPLNLGKLTDVAAGTLVTPDVLAHDGLIGDTTQPVKILGVGDAPKGVTIHAHAFSRTAADKLAAAGSTIQRLSWPDNAPVDEEAEAAAEADAAARAKRRKAKGRKGATAGSTPASAPSGEASEAPASTEAARNDEAATAGTEESEDAGETEGGPEA